MVVIEEPIHRDLAVGILEPVFGLLAPVLYNHLTRVGTLLSTSSLQFGSGRKQHIFGWR